MGNRTKVDHAPATLQGDAWDRYELKDELEAFLREAGTPREVHEREARLFLQFREILRTLPPDSLTEEQRFFIKETLGILRGHLTKLRSQSEWAVAMLGQKGLRFNAENRAVERLPGFSKVRQRRFFEDVLAAYREGGHQTGNTRGVRVHIARALRGEYPAEVLSPRKFFPIWQVLDEALDDEA